MVDIADTIKYFYIIHGVIPELMPDIAYRGQSKAQHERKVLKCPHCDRRLTDMDTGTRVELYQHPVRVQVQCQFYIKCFHCGNEVGINIA